MATASAPESSTAVRAMTASNQPVRRGRPVDVPNSLPRVAQELAGRVRKLGRKRAAADARRVGLEHDEGSLERARRDLEARRHGRRRAVGRRHEGIGSRGDVEHRAVRPFGRAGFRRRSADRGDSDPCRRRVARGPPPASASSARHRVAGRHVRRTERLGQRAGLGREARDPIAQRGPDGRARRRGSPCATAADSYAGPIPRSVVPIFAVAGRRLAGGVEQPVVGEDDLGAVGEQQVRADLDALRADGRDLVEEGLGVDDDAGPDDSDAAADDPGRKQMEGEVAVAELDGVARVVAAVVARDDVEAIGEQVDDLPFALVAPLAAEDGCDSHGRIVSSKKRCSVTDSRRSADDRAGAR